MSDVDKKLEQALAENARLKTELAPPEEKAALEWNDMPPERRKYWQGNRDEYVKSRASTIRQGH